MAHPFYTIGHGTRSLHDFVDPLRSVEVTLVVDVRTVPRSRTNPQYNRDTLPDQLSAVDIGYEHIAALGGLRGRFREVSSLLVVLRFYNRDGGGVDDLFHFRAARQQMHRA